MESASTPGDLDIQIRFRGNPAWHYTINDAVAIRYLSDTVNVYFEPPRSVLVNGESVSEGIHELSSGSALNYNGQDVVFSAPDGSTVEMRAVASAHARVEARLPSARMETVNGLCGNYDGDKTTELSFRGGPVYVNPPSSGSLAASATAGGYRSGQQSRCSRTGRIFGTRFIR